MTKRRAAKLAKRKRTYDTMHDSAEVAPSRCGMALGVPGGMLLVQSSQECIKSRVRQSSQECVRLIAPPHTLAAASPSGSGDMMEDDCEALECLWKAIELICERLIPTSSPSPGHGEHSDVTEEFRIHYDPNYTRGGIR